MNRARIFLVLLIALGAGGGLAFGTYNYLQNVPVKTVNMPTKRVVVRMQSSVWAPSCRDDSTTVDGGELVPRRVEDRQPIVAAA